MAYNPHPKIAVIGLGYVGLPLAVALARSFSVIGYDINETRIRELRAGQDRTGEVHADVLKCSALRTTTEPVEMAGCDVYIVTVPTPVTEAHVPDLLPLKKASEAVGKVLQKKAIVVFESTVYPGVTEDVCGPILEAASGLRAGIDFYLGYSPERINPGDKAHTVESITKVISGQTQAVVEQLRTVYGALNHNQIFIAKNIKTAEAAKVIENAQRDINIAFINEITTIVGKLGLSVYDVLDAASTKWNFLQFRPGLVGGHCIGVDPYYLAHCARQVAHEPEVILAGRRINEQMGPFIAACIHNRLQAQGSPMLSAHILVLGLTFKEDIPDLRNTKVIDVIVALQKAGHSVHVHDPYADVTEAKRYYDLDVLETLSGAKDYDCVVGAVSHKPYLQFTPAVFQALLKPTGLVADIKQMWQHVILPESLRYWTL